MVFNNLRISFRHLAKNKLNTALHIVGLTIGITVCLMIALFIRHDLSFDTYHRNYDRIYRVTSSWQDGENIAKHFSTPLPMADALRSAGTAFESVVLAHPQSKAIIDLSGGKKLLEDKVLIVSPEFVDVFSVETVRGDSRSALAKPYYALLTESTARKFFGDQNALGKTFIYKNEFNITVGAVIKDFPSTTHLDAGLIMSYVPNENYLGTGFNSWTVVSGSSLFVVLKEGFSLTQVEKQLADLADQHINSDPELPQHVRAGFGLQRLDNVHFQPEFAGGGPWGGAIHSQWLWIFGSIGLAVLFLACINFINLSTAQALTRAREVGVRKSIGAGRGQLIFQFLTEAWLLALVSGVIAITVVQALLPLLNDMLKKTIVFEPLQSLGLLGAILAGIVTVGLLAGVYPSWVIARLNPASALKSSSAFTRQDGSQWLRSSLMITQFVVSASLLVAVLLISDQVKFLRDKNLGFDKENVLNVPLPFGQHAKLEALLGDVSQIKDFSFASSPPSAEAHWGSIMTRTNADDPSRYDVTMLLADNHYGPMYGLQLVAGRFNVPSDTNYVSRRVPHHEQLMKCVVNETLVKTLGFASNDAAIGKRFWFGMMSNGNAEIVGVVKDFNTNSLHQAVVPVLIVSMPGVYAQVGIKLHARADLTETIAAIEQRWSKAYPDGVFEYNFLDQQINSFYKTEMRIFSLFRIFSVLAMLISCLGLWGLAAFVTKQRTKEIGIRKILGASSQNIMVLLSKDFVVMVMVALAIACPLASYAMNTWLSNFAFHIDIGMKVFIVAGSASITIALLVVSFQTITAALSNPVESLKAE